MKVVCFILSTFLYFSAASGEVTMKTFSEARKRSAVKSLLCSDNEALMDKVVKEFVSGISCSENKGSGNMDCEIRSATGKRVQIAINNSTEKPELLNVSFEEGRSLPRTTFDLKKSSGRIVPVNDSGTRVGQ